MSLPINKYNTNLIPLSKKKPIYYLENNPDVFVKVFTHDKIKEMKNEFNIHQKASKIVTCPKLIDCFEENNVGYLLMEKINGKSLAELYGNNPKDIPKNIWSEIHMIIYKLYYENIHYVDITPYNFIVKNDSKQIIIIDFVDAYISEVNWFLKDFLDGENSWNSDFD